MNNQHYKLSYLSSRAVGRLRLFWNSRSHFFLFKALTACGVQYIKCCKRFSAAKRADCDKFNDGTPTTRDSFDEASVWLDTFAAGLKRQIDDFVIEAKTKLAKEKIELLARHEAELEELRIRHKLEMTQLKMDMKKKRDRGSSTRDKRASDGSRRKKDFVNLNVGGHKFTTTRRTLTSAEGSMLQSMFSARWTSRDENEYSIDRNGKYFGDILDFLRHGKILPPKNDRHRMALLEEAKYYQLKNLVILLGGYQQQPEMEWIWDVDHCCEMIKIGYDGKNVTRNQSTPDDAKGRLRFPAVFGANPVILNQAYEIKITRQYGNANQYVIFGVDKDNNVTRGRSAAQLDHVYQFEGIKRGSTMVFIISQDHITFTMDEKVVAKKKITTKDELYPVAIIGDFSVQII